MKLGIHCKSHYASFYRQQTTFHSLHACAARKLPWKPRFLRCTKASPLRIERASLRPEISASRRPFLSSYVSGLAMQRSLILPSYSKTAPSSVLVVSRSEESSETVLSRLLNSAVSYFTDCSFMVLVILFSWVCFSYSAAASAS